MLLKHLINATLAFREKLRFPGVFGHAQLLSMFPPMHPCLMKICHLRGGEAAIIQIEHLKQMRQLPLNDITRDLEHDVQRPRHQAVALRHGRPHFSQRAAAAPSPLQDSLLMAPNRAHSRSQPRREAFASQNRQYSGPE